MKSIKNVTILAGLPKNVARALACNLIFTEKVACEDTSLGRLKECMKSIKNNKHIVLIVILFFYQLKSTAQNEIDIFFGAVGGN